MEMYSVKSKVCSDKCAVLIYRQEYNIILYKPAASVILKVMRLIMGHDPRKFSELYNAWKMLFEGILWAVVLQLKAIAIVP